MSILDKFNNLHSRRKMAIIFGSVITVFALVGLFFFNARTQKREISAKTGEIANVAMTSDLLEDTLTERVETRVKKLEEQNEGLRKLVRELTDAVNLQNKDAESALKEFERDADRKLAKIDRFGSDTKEPGGEKKRDGATDLDLTPKNELADMGAYRVANSYPPPPKDTSGASPVALAPAHYEPVETKLLGAISAMPATGFEAPQKKSKNSETTIFLPPGFMNARLLTGVDALVSQNAQGNPEPIIARVQAPAVLPNHVRANLQGCFVVGNATGSLAKERVEVRAVSLSCIDYQERAVIDEPIKGFFVDADGKKGLSGRVVTRAGALLSRSFLAGVLSGFGEAVQATSGSRSISALGEVRTFDPEDAALAGLGGGIGQASEDLSELYLELARQAGPVVEVGAGKDVVLVIQEGVALNVRRGVNVAQ